MPRVHLALKKSLDESYDIEIERGLFRRVASDLRMKRFAERYIVITDKTVGRHFAVSLCSALKREKLFLGKIVVPAGESSKSFTQLEKILEEMVKLDANRKTGVIALGGGMVGDLAGFAAAVFMRGIPLVQTPSSLLAMVDSSVGGKTAVDLPSGKNLAGAFWQPRKVYIDPEMLESLPRSQWKSGLAEAIKYGIIYDRSLFELFENNVEIFKKESKRLLPSEWKIVEDIIHRCISIKANVVMKDEKESGLRQILNYGHTFGHVIENMSGYKVLHGEAIAVGMRLAAALAVKLRYMPSSEMEKQNALFDTLGIGKAKTKGLIKDFIQHMKKDKKSRGELRVVLVDRIGRCHQELGHFSVKVDEKTVKQVLEESGMIDGQVQGGESYSQSSWSQPTWVQPAKASSSFSNPMDYSTGETELQRRLREMRERREQAQREGGKWLPG